MSDLSEISAANTPPTMGAENLLRYQPTDWMRVTSALDQIVIDVVLPDVGDLPYPLQGIEWSTVLPLYTNAGPDDTWRVTAAPSLATIGTPTFDTGYMNLLKVASTAKLPWKHGFYWTARDPLGGDLGIRTERFLRIFANATQNPDGFLQWGRLYVCKPWQPPNHCTRGVKLRHDEKARRIETEGGAIRAAIRPRPRVLDVTVDFVSRAEAMAEAYELDRTRGNSEDVAVIYDPDDPMNMHKLYVSGLFEGPDGLNEEDGDDFSHSYTVRELRSQIVSKRRAAA